LPAGLIPEHQSMRFRIYFDVAGDEMRRFIDEAKASGVTRCPIATSKRAPFFAR